MATQTTAQDVLRISPEALSARMAGGETVVPVDVRTMDARLFQPVQLPNARWLPIAEIVQQAHTLPRQSLIALYCT
jgi:rhodanese-related sulfurtransferase